MARAGHNNLTTSERDMLRTIIFCGLAIPRDLSGIERRAIIALQARGLVEVTPRASFVVATPAGRALLARAVAL